MKVLASGGFDPIHVGHVRYLLAAAQMAGKNEDLIVVVNSDGWLKRKKGRAFMSSDERCEIVSAIVPGARIVNAFLEKDDDIAYQIEYWRPQIFAKGGDRTLDNIPADELDMCVRVGAIVAVNVGGQKVQSSSDLLAAYEARKP